MQVEIAAVFLPFVEAALLRLRYLYPSVEFHLLDNKVDLGDGPAEQQERLGRELHYAIYREKIYAETLSLRAGLVAAVASK